MSYLYNGNIHTWKDPLYIEAGPRSPPFYLPVACQTLPEHNQSIGTDRQDPGVGHPFTLGPHTDVRLQPEPQQQWTQ